MKWLYKLSHLIWPEHDISNTAREPRTPELSKRWQRRHIAHGVEGKPVPVQMSGVSNQLSATNGQNAYGVRSASNSHRHQSNHTSGFTLRKREIKITPQSEEELQEERRLLGGSNRKDPNAVRITPGALLRRGAGTDLKSFAKFAPRNTLISRADRKQIHTLVGSDRNKPLRSVSLGQDASDLLRELEEGKRPRKRRRTDDSHALAEVIVVNDDDPIIRSESPSSPRPNSYDLRHLSQNTPISNNRGPTNQRESTTHEFWNVERRMQDFKSKRPQTPNVTEDELFTMEAKAQRLGRKIGTAIARPGGPGLSGASEKASAVVGVPPINNLGGACATESETHSSTDKLADSFARTGSQRRGSYTRESPDELQGDKTVPEAWRGGAAKDRLDTMQGDISPTNFSVVMKKDRKRTDKRHRDSPTHMHSFSVTMFRDTVRTVEEWCTLIAKDGTFFVKSDNGPWMSKEFLIEKINSIWHGGPRVAVKFPMVSGSIDELKIQFSSEKEAIGYCKLMWELNNDVKLRDKASGWMESMFKRAVEERRQGIRNLGGSKRESPQGAQIGIVRPSTQPKRQKLSESLRDSDGATRISPLEDTLQLRGSRKGGKHISPPLSPSHLNSDPPIPIPVKTYNTNVDSRVTRSRKRMEPTNINSDHELSPSPLRDGSKWLKSLVYPPQGKRKAEVEFHDLERLRDGEYLNDNLIGFYLRFLEYHMETKRPDLAKRVYFFNSFFFASLTKTPKGQKINYQAVEKWTRNVDLFSYDYIIVPINEKAHWYMAIICNIPALCDPKSIVEHHKPGNGMADDSPHRQGRPDLGNRGTGQNDIAVLQRSEDNDTVAQTLGNRKDQLQNDFDSMSLSDNRPEIDTPQNDTSPESQDKSEWPDEGENGPLVSIVQTEEELNTSPQSNQRKSLRSGKLRDFSGTMTKKSHRKFQYDPKEPVIITFDSLGCSRSPTVRILRLYLEEEGRAKRSLTIDTRRIGGMAAQHIPHQPNFSDCGLYLLTYLEKFMWDPDMFIRKLVRKEMNQYDDWPPMKSRVLRRRLRNFLLKLHEEEGRLKRNEADEGPRLIDTEPLKILLVDDPPSKVPKSETAPLNDSAGLEQNPEIKPASPAQANRLVVRGGQQEPRQEPSTRALVKLNQNEQIQISKAPVTLKDEAVQQSEPEKLLSGILLYGGEDSTNNENITEIPRTPSPDNIRPDSRSQNVQGHDQEILDGIE
ncbi:Ulp1 protease [Histoplasma capsulatum var. duboisii H88]|uniref:Ulp1 protease n=1 Tax=Ajellomyces capsulatus (strain H88) TaxID=544711 RepID=A0A8A1LMT8_AJEC8|nr:Ulp1 protease [Histoplasma capsulatum var. duboisii H88]